MLEVAGLGATEEQVYRLLIKAAEAGADEIAAVLGIGVQAVEDALATMRAGGLVRVVVTDDEDGGTGDRFAPVAPDVALGPRLRSRQETLDWARRTVTMLTEEYRGNLRRRDVDQLVEVLPDKGAVREQLRHLQNGAREEVLCFVQVGHIMMAAADNTEEPEALRRGVDYQVVYERAVLEEPGMVANVAYGVRLGERARSVLRLPVRMMIFDRKTAILPLVRREGGIGEPTAALVRGSSLLEALIALFECHWERATPLRVGEDGALTGTDPATPLAEADRYLLSLLVAGVPDKSIASQLGLSRRTVQRRIYHLMEQAGAQTRMQLAWHAAREHWL